MLQQSIRFMHQMTTFSVTKLCILHPETRVTNDYSIGWQNLYLLSQPNAQARASVENLNYVTLAPQARQARLSGEILNYSLSRSSDILSMIIELPSTHAETFWSMMDVDMQSTFIFFILRIQQRHF